MSREPPAGQFAVGDRVRWSRVNPDLGQPDIVGTIRTIIPHKRGLPALTMYQVEFDFGTFTLYGTQIEATIVVARLPRNSENGK